MSFRKRLLSCASLKPAVRNSRKPEFESIKRPAAPDPTEQEVPETTCSVCGDIYYEPVALECGHVFCRDCISGIVVRFQRERARVQQRNRRRNDAPIPTPTRPSCPLCRGEMPSSPRSVIRIPVHAFTEAVVTIHRHPDSVRRRQDRAQSARTLIEQREAERKQRELEKRMKIRNAAYAGAHIHSESDSSESDSEDAPYRFDDERLPPAMRLFRDAAGRVQRRAPSMIYPWQLEAHQKKNEKMKFDFLFSSNGQEDDEDPGTSSQHEQTTDAVDWDAIEMEISMSRSSKPRSRSSTRARTDSVKMFTSFPTVVRSGSRVASTASTSERMSSSVETSSPKRSGFGARRSSSLPVLVPRTTKSRSCKVF